MARAKPITALLNLIPANPVPRNMATLHSKGYEQQTTFIKHASQVGTIPLYLTASLWKMSFGSKIALLESI
ncbi:hypothetical protein SRHO_G00108150 [Serrasalmus rhombeus]